MTNASENLRPTCFMVMPFGTKPVTDARGKAPPVEVDFDALWEQAFRPAIEALKLEPIRADADSGTLIIKDMVERLAYADVVIADVSLPNGNVYYEVGIRHAAEETGCVLLAADWSKQLFDIDQVRTIRYPHARETVSDEEAKAISELLMKHVPAARNAPSPYHELVGRAAPEAQWRGVFHKQAKQLAEFEAELREVRLIADREDRYAKALALAESTPKAALDMPSVAAPLLEVLRDTTKWHHVRHFIESDNLPDRIRELPYFREQYLLAVAKTGDTLQSIAQLETLIEHHGSTPERQGLIGGRYKELWNEAREKREETGSEKPSADEKQYLSQAIAHYEAGMTLDLNEYYCSCNLPALLKARGREEDIRRARSIERVVIEACERAVKLGTDDEWLRPTLLGVAVRASDWREAERIADLIEESTDRAAWQITSTLSDVRGILDQLEEDSDSRNRLEEVFARLKKLDS